MKLVLYRISNIVAAPLLLAATILTALATALGCMLGGERWWGYYPASLWARLFCWLTFVRVRVSGRGNVADDLSCVFVCNHQGAYDIFAVYGFLGHKFKWMMKRGLEKIPLVGYACRAAVHIFVDNSSPAAVRRTMDEAQRRLRRGMSLVVFPEGSRSFDGKMRKFKRGAFQLAAEFGLPLVPVTIDGSFEVMPRFKKLPRRGEILITIHPPVAVPEKGRDTSSLAEECGRIIRQALPERFQ